MTHVHAFGDDALGTLDAVGLVEQLAAGRVSVPEVVDAAIERCERVDGALNGLAHEAFERARAEARAPRAGFFSGVPTFVKDNVDVRGLPTQDGCDAYVSAPKAADGDFFRMYGATGLLPLGKTQLSEFGFSAAAEHPRLGAVRNPWSTDHTAGASSAGSAAFVAAGVVPIAHANDGGGSIRIPAGACGLVGLKPTRDRFAQDEVHRGMPVRIVADGVVTRSVRDTAAYLREAEKVYRNLRLPPVGDVTRPGHARLRVAVVTTSVDGGATPEVRERTLEVARLLESLGHHVTELDTPPVPAWFKDDFLLYWGFLSTYLVRTGRFTRQQWDPTRLDNLTLGLARYSARRVHRLPRAIARLSASHRVTARLFAEHDVVLTPTVAGPTPLVGHLDPTQPFETVIERLMEWVAFTPLQNATGDPAISLPLATDADGLPLGMMFSAARGREALLLGLALELEDARPWRHLHEA
ncbi:amidase [Nocardioides sp. ChNu-153]|uniref:amidase n=1 Tax=unclassified Nocardioides TaxID=2615069 RepID=UPI0024060271|nr:MULTISPECIES: amidase [unclassified Nocardioides]MDF9714564.1 amidase [Nocardioides sp. ChNu-99]MDN7119903.1 amidase [Nocardioides sp. ChNu-153]